MQKPWIPTRVDLGLSLIIAVAFPFLASLLYQSLGAFIPMILYYGLAWGISKWRRGSTGYFNPMPKKIPIPFLINVGVICVSLVFAYFARIISTDTTIFAIILTGLIWAPINAASEQLLWIYIFEAWDLYPTNQEKSSKNKWLLRIIGLILFLVFVGTIHTMFWTKFLHTVEPSTIFGILFVIGTSISGFLHLIVWRKSNQMIFTFIPHFILNLLPLFWTAYSILPFLF